MSLFGLGDFEDDFMGSHMNAMNMQMRSMNRLMNSLMPDPFNMLAPFDGMQQNALMERSHRGNPLGGVFGFPAMPNINRLLNADINNPNGASYCSSSVVTMTSGPDGRPQIYQSSTSTKTGPGGVRETRKTVQDSRRGIKKMAIGHHIGDRAHIIEKEQDLNSGQMEERQEFINLEEEEAQTFDREFITRAHGNARAPREVLTIEDIDDDDEQAHYRRQQGRRQLPALPEAPSHSSSSDATTTETTTTRTTAPTASTTLPSSLSSSSSSSTAHRAAKPLTTTRANANAIDAYCYHNNNNNYISSTSSRRAAAAYRNSHLLGATPRRPLRTPSSSPLTTTPTNHSLSTAATLSVHPHPYNPSAARRNHRSKHSQQHQQPHPQIVELFDDTEDEEAAVPAEVATEVAPPQSSASKKHASKKKSSSNKHKKH